MYGSKGGNLAEYAQSIRQEEVETPTHLSIQLQEVLSSNIQNFLNTFLECIPSLGVDLATWVANDRRTPQEKEECDFIEEDTDKKNVAMASWEGGSCNVILSVTHKNYQPIPSIVDRGSGINIISQRFYDEWNMPTMEKAPFSYKSSRSE